MKLELRTGAALLLTVALLVQAPLALAQATGRVQTMTRQVMQFMELESRSIDAQGSRDAKTLQSLLADDFELRVAQRPGNPLPRADWLKAQADLQAAPASIEQMAVHDLGSVANVSYLMRPEGGVPLFMVDTWVRDGDGWRLKVRYASPVAVGAEKTGKVQAQPKL